MKPVFAFLFAGSVSVVGCDKEAPTATPGEAAPAGASVEAPVAVVPNLDAQPGDTTTCPFSGRTFVVQADHPKVDYEGKSYWICSEEAAEQVRADPEKYLAEFEG
jgi:YHS domain-containing protein